MAYRLDKETKRMIAKIDKEDYAGYKIGELRKVFSKYQDKTRWKNPISAYIFDREEANKLKMAIRYFQGDVATEEIVSVPVRHKEGLVTMEGKAYHIKSRGYMCE
jgi:hypothetical protein